MGAAFKSVEVTRLVAGAIKGGWPLGSFKIVLVDGHPALLPTRPVSADGAGEEGAPNEWDEVLPGAR